MYYNIKTFVFIAFSLFILSPVQAQYSNYNSTRKSNNGYSTNQSYYGSKGSSNVNTTRSYNSSGAYNSSTTVTKNGSVKSTSTTYSSPYSGTTTVKQNYNNGTSSYKYSSPKSSYNRTQTTIKQTYKAK